MLHSNGRVDMFDTEYRPKIAMATKKATKPRKKTTQASKASRDPVARLRKICLSLPETSEVEAWTAPTFRVKGKIFVMYASPSSHHTGGRPAAWIMSIHVEQDLVLRARPD